MNEYDYGFKREDLGPGLITAGLSMLSNNDGRMSVPQLIGQGGLDAIAGLQFRKQMEAQQARQQLLDARAQAQHDMQMQKGQFELDEANRRAELMKRWQAGDQSVYKILFPEEWAADQREMMKHRNALALEAIKQGANVPAQGGIDWNSDFGKTLSKEYAKRYADLQKNFESSLQFDAMLGGAEEALSRGIYTGPGGELVQKGREWGGALGMVDPRDVAAGENLRKIQNEMALITRNPEQGMGMPGAVSDKDIEFLKSIQVGLGRSPEANKQFLMAARAIQARKKAVMEMANEYVMKHGRLDPNFDRELRKIAMENELFAGWKPVTDRPRTGTHSRKDGGVKYGEKGDISRFDN